MKERLTTLLTAVAALGAVIFLLSPNTQNGQRPPSVPSTEDRGADGLKGLFAWLQNEHFTVSSLRKRYTALNQTGIYPEQGNVLIVSLPTPEAVAKTEWAALSTWLVKGNSLIILGAVYQHPAWAKNDDCFCEVKTLLAGHQWFLNTTQKEDDDEEAAKAGSKTATHTAPEKNPPKSFRETLTTLQTKIKGHLPQTSQLLPLSAHPVLHGVKTLETQITAELLPNHWALTSGNQDNLAIRLLKLADQDIVTAWQLKVGNGQIVLMLTPDMFSNSRLNHQDNALFLRNLLSLSLTPQGHVLFDDYHWGLSELYDPEHFFKDPRLYETLACLGLLWLFYVIGHTTRLAPVRMPAPALSVHDFIDVMAEFFARRVNKRLLAEALVKHLLTDICLHRRLANEAEAWRWLERHTHISDRQLTLLKQAQAGQRLSLAQLTNTLSYIRTVSL